MAEEKNYKQSNKEHMLLAISLLFPEYKDKFVMDWSELSKSNPRLASKAEFVYDKLKLAPKVETIERLPEKTVFQTASKISRSGFSDSFKDKDGNVVKVDIEEKGYYKILGTDDEKTCPNCAKWHNKIICMSGSDPRYPSYDEFLNDHIFHPNCRCSLHPIQVPPPNLNTLSMNTDPSIKDELLYTGFIDPYIDPKINEDGICKPVTYDYGETLVQLTPLGNYKGWDGEKAVDQIIDEQAITSIIQELESNPREILVDIDHGSCRSPNERDTQAAAWAYDFKYVKDLGNLSGLYCRLKWTSKGRSLVENREYRFLSPVWTLNLDNRPQKLISIGLTNRPAIKSTPIINTLPEVKEMTEEEIKTLVNSCMEETKKEITNSLGDPWTEEKIVELIKKVMTESKPKEEEKKEETKEEVIKEEVLNTDPNTVVQNSHTNYKDELNKLKGEDFIAYASAHKKELLENW